MGDRKSTRLNSSHPLPDALPIYSPLNFIDPSGLDKCPGQGPPALSPREAMAAQGVTNLVSNTISLAANLDRANYYGAYRSFFGMMSSDALIYGRSEEHTSELQSPPTRRSSDLQPP